MKHDSEKLVNTSTKILEYLVKQGLTYGEFIMCLELCKIRSIVAFGEDIQKDFKESEILKKYDKEMGYE
jgi:hypothetical protein